MVWSSRNNGKQCLSSKCRTFKVSDRFLVASFHHFQQVTIERWCLEKMLLQKMLSRQHKNLQEVNHALLNTWGSLTI